MITLKYHHSTISSSTKAQDEKIGVNQDVHKVQHSARKGVFWCLYKITEHHTADGMRKLYTEVPVVYLIEKFNGLIQLKLLKMQTQAKP